MGNVISIKSRKEIFPVKVKEEQLSLELVRVKYHKHLRESAGCLIGAAGLAIMYYYWGTQNPEKSIMIVGGLFGIVYGLVEGADALSCRHYIKSAMLRK